MSPRTAGLPLVHLEGVELGAAGRPVLQQVDWTLRAGEHWAVLGANGSGKSLLAAALGRRARPSRGRILFFDGDGHPRLYPERGEVARVSAEELDALVGGGYHQARWHSFEGEASPTVDRVLTGESLEFVSVHQVGPTRTPAAVYRQRRREAVERLGIGPLLDRRLLHLSHGEGRRVLIARALMASARLLVLDDPYTGLDRASRDALARVIADLLGHAEPTVLFLTARPDEVPQGVAGVLCLEGGRAMARAPGSAPPDLRARGQSAAPSTQGHPTAAPPRGPRPASAAPVGEPLIEVEAACVTYGATRILDGVDWTVRQGERWALLGPNGSGKSTLLSLILGDNPQAYANRIRVFGRPRGSGESIWEVKARIGWVAPELQRYYPPETPLASVVASGHSDSLGAYRPCSANELARARAWLDALELGPLAGHPFGDLSAGERRLGLLARALVKDPSLLVLDEPCQALDPRQRERVLELLERLGAGGDVTWVCVAHRPDELPGCLTHGLELERGRVRRCGPLDGPLRSEE
ncbi:MAG: ATP-binding cassette domain-containing protein [Candidatus Latescibacterota bacterium]